MVAAGSAGKHADFGWDDFVPALREMAIWDGKLSGIPYRVTMGVLHYQKALLEQVGIAKAPEETDPLEARSGAAGDPPAEIPSTGPTAASTASSTNLPPTTDGPQP